METKSKRVPFYFKYFNFPFTDFILLAISIIIDKQGQMFSIRTLVKVLIRLEGLKHKRDLL